MPNKINRFPKKEKLCNKSAIDSIFEHGDSFYIFPYKIYFIPNNLDYNRLLVTVPKKIHKQANTRNLLKRRIREGWRTTDKAMVNGFDIAIIYTGNPILEYQTIKKSIENGLAKIKESID